MFILDRLGAFVSAIRFEDDVVADAQDERAEAVAIADFAATATAQVLENAEEGVLHDIVDRLRRTQSAAHLDPQNGREIRDEMLLGPAMDIPQTADVVVVKGKKVHVQGVTETLL